MLDCDNIKGRVYKAESLEGKTYVGCTTQPLLVRASQHIAEAWNGRKMSCRSKWMQALLDHIDEVDWLQWSVLEEIEGERWQLYARERWWIRALHSEKEGYNGTRTTSRAGEAEHLETETDFAGAQVKTLETLCRVLGSGLQVGNVLDARRLDGPCAEKAAIACFDARCSLFRDYRKRVSRQETKAQSTGIRAITAANRVLGRWYGLKLVRQGTRRSTRYEVQRLALPGDL